MGLWLPRQQASVIGFWLLGHHFPSSWQFSKKYIIITKKYIIITKIYIHYKKCISLQKYIIITKIYIHYKNIFITKIHIHYKNIYSLQIYMITKIYNHYKNIYSLQNICSLQIYYHCKKYNHCKIFAFSQTSATMLDVSILESEYFLVTKSQLLHRKKKFFSASKFAKVKRLPCWKTSVGKIRKTKAQPNDGLLEKLGAGVEGPVGEAVDQEGPGLEDLTDPASDHRQPDRSKSQELYSPPRRGFILYTFIFQFYKDVGRNVFQL